jgi:DDE superfamily endonuclease
MIWTAARECGLLAVLASNNVTTFADKGYQGAGGTVRSPFKRLAARPRLSSGQKAVNRAHARIRALGERAVATLKDWKGQIQPVEAFDSTSSVNNSEGFFQL